MTTCNGFQLKNALDRIYEKYIIRSEPVRKKAKEILKNVNEVIENHLKNCNLQEKYGLRFENVQYFENEWEGRMANQAQTYFDIAYYFVINKTFWRIERLSKVAKYENVPFKIVENGPLVGLYSRKLKEMFCSGKELKGDLILKAIVKECQIGLHDGILEKMNLQVIIESTQSSMHLDIRCATAGFIRTNINIVINFKDFSETRSMAYHESLLPNRSCWVESFALKEKNYMKFIDQRDNGCRSKIYKIIKVLIKKAFRNPEKPFHGISSYVVKNAIFFVNDLHDGWSDEDMAERFKDTLLLLERAYGRGVLLRYFEKNSEANVLNRFITFSMACTSNRLKESRRKYRYRYMLK